MGLSKTLLLNPATKRIAFSGGKDRELLMHRLSDELVREGKHVLITNIATQKIPLSNSIVISKNMSLLPQLIEEEFPQNKKIYFGKALQGDKVSGFTPGELSKLETRFPPHFLLIDLGSSGKNNLPNKRKLKQALRAGLWDQLIITFELKMLNQPLSEENSQEFADFKSLYPDANRLEEELFLEFLSDENKGLGFLFRSEVPTLFLFTDIEFLSLANRAMSFAREAVKKGIHSIGYVDWDTNLIKMIGRA